MNYMYLRFLCTEDICLKDYDEYCREIDPIVIKEREEFNALLTEEGMRVEKSKNTYSLPYGLSAFAGKCITAFDKELYEDIYTHVQDMKLHFGNEEYYIGDAVVKIKR